MSKEKMAVGQSPIVVRVKTNGEQVPSFKNSKRSILDRNTGKQRTLTPAKIKKRMQQIEDAIVSGFYSLCQTEDAETALECRKRLRTVLSELSDDSLKEIPEFSFSVERIKPGSEGVIITIEKL